MLAVPVKAFLSSRGSTSSLLSDRCDRVFLEMVKCRERGLKISIH